MASDVPFFNKEKHISYWLRCFRSPLPHQYTSNDANRMTLAFFTVSALDLLGVLFTRCTADERGACADWIYHCQHPDGGFRAFPATDLGSRRNESNRVWDPANVPATYFALAALAVLRDDMSRVKRLECLAWLRTMQRPDGGFGETLGENGSISGGTDARFGYCAMVSRWILRGSSSSEADVDVNNIVTCIRSCETYSGGISDVPFHEAHAGFTYCSIAILSLLDRFKQDSTTNKNITPASGLGAPDTTIRWLVSRLTTLIQEADSNEDDDPSDDDPTALLHGQGLSNLTLEQTHTSPHVGFQPRARDTASGSNLAAHLWDPNTSTAGFNGRPNKIADTCYAFWVGGALSILQKLDFLSLLPIRRFLLTKTQHMVAGGFGKLVGYPPDIYHSYLALAILSLIDETPKPRRSTSDAVDEFRPISAPLDEDVIPKSGLEALDPTFCFSVKAREWVEGLPWHKDS